MCNEQSLWEKAVDFHGHSCMGLAAGFKVAERALEALGDRRDIDEEMVAVVENDSCAVDAIQLVTGCTVGKGNLLFCDYGKQAYTFTLRKSGKSVRITFEYPDEERMKKIRELREKLGAGKGEKDDGIMLQELITQAQDDLLKRPASEVTNLKEIDFRVPEKARIFSSVPCAHCGEMVMEARARVKDGKMSCIPCADNYSRGWGTVNLKGSI